MGKPLRARYSKIEVLTDSLLADAQITAPFVKIESLIKSRGIRILEADLEEVSGLLLRSDNEILIGVNKLQADVRRRFTMAHEFGHFMLHIDIEAHYDTTFIPRFRSSESSQATNVEEIEANFFAASLLMPKKFLVADKAMLCMDSDEEVRALAKRYRVSRHAMSLRISNLFGDHRLF